MSACQNAGLIPFGTVQREVVSKLLCSMSYRKVGKVVLIPNAIIKVFELREAIFMSKTGIE